DDSQRPFRPDEHPVGTRTRARSRQPAGFYHSAWGHDTRRFDEFIDMRIKRREMTSRACRDPSAERGELEGLRKMAEREVGAAQLVLQAWAINAGLDAGGARYRVHFHDAIQMAQVD